jgi:hypothetical protein
MSTNQTLAIGAFMCAAAVIVRYGHDSNYFVLFWAIGCASIFVESIIKGSNPTDVTPRA